MNRMKLFFIINYAVMTKGNIVIALVVLVIVFMIILTAYLERTYRKLRNNIYCSKELLYNIDKDIDNIFIVYDAYMNKFEYISPNFEAKTEINREILLKNRNNMINFMPTNMHEKIVNFYKTNLDNKKFEDDFEYTRPITKTKCWVMLNIYRVNMNNKTIKFIIYATDISREKQIQKELEEALTDLHKANEAKKKFLSHISHELKTPISGIIGMTQIAHKSLEDIGKIENCLNKIDYSSRKLLTLINNILDLSRIDSDKLVLSQEPFHLYEVLNAFSSVMNAQAELKLLDYQFITQDIHHYNLIGDSLRFVQILENCLSNAIKFTKTGGKIKFEVTEIGNLEDEAMFRFIISDTGKGMSEDFLEHLFVPFEQEDYSITKRYGGTGIGMAIAKELIDLMGGSIKVESKVGIGTIIQIDILFDINKSPIISRTSKGDEKKPIQYDCFESRVLVVEDNEINLEITCELLKNINLRVTGVRNGYEAIEVFEKSEQGFYDVILMDLQMPELDGYETAKAIRNSAHPDAKSVCIIALTADDFLDDQKSYEHGMNYHFKKSIHQEKIFGVIQEIAKERVL